MVSFSPRALAYRAIVGLVALNLAQADPLDTSVTTDGLVPRKFTLADGSTTTIYENPNVLFTRGAAPAAPQHRSLISKRLSYSACGGAFSNDYCGEPNAVESYGSGTPLAADCSAIAQAYRNTCGYWTVTEVDGRAAGAGDVPNGANGWVTLAQRGTCAFRVRLQTRPFQNLYFGTNDIQFYINTYVPHAKNGHIQAVSGVWCSNNVDRTIEATWGMYKP
ncbi:hypothetical protein B0H63DRAFT_214044 [Podospora didyma]|uniref:Ecp2 effector protein-like domain-containing protein n=1 Tax=Podospora didyma TaxID=330526 RepID=A0AAE0NHU3_9PEZI|nr:hypothetical protein B0H63DRAFT_214044 [Podospora didyma]